MCVSNYGQEWRKKGKKSQSHFDSSEKLINEGFLCVRKEAFFCCCCVHLSSSIMTWRRSGELESTTHDNLPHLTCCKIITISLLCSLLFALCIKIINIHWACSLEFFKIWWRRHTHSGFIIQLFCNFTSNQVKINNHSIVYPLPLLISRGLFYSLTHSLVPCLTIPYNPSHVICHNRFRLHVIAAWFIFILLASLLLFVFKFYQIFYFIVRNQRLLRVLKSWKNSSKNLRCLRM